MVFLFSSYGYSEVDDWSSYGKDSGGGHYSKAIEITPETLGIAGATSTLYYYCSNHSGMGGQGAINLYSSGGGGDIHSFFLMGA